jgi:probable rRNA maturation factor
MITIDLANEQSTLPLDGRRLRRAVRMVLEDGAVRRARISLAVVDDPTIRRLNREYLDHDCATDVLSFNLGDSGGPLEGEVIVSADTAAAAAPRFGWRPEDELLLYVIHGALHLVGLRDGTDGQRERMRRRERECLDRFGLEPHDEEPAALECGDLSRLFLGRCQRQLPAARNNASKAATSRRTPECGQAGPKEAT